ncbi:MAG: 30S ribosomal protein S8 [Patescibacteria group bacterium]
MTDPIADMIIRIKNATESKKESVVIPFSSIKLAIADVLFKNGYIKSFGKKGKKVVKFIEVGLAYADGEGKVKGMERVSKTSKRVYTKSKDLRRVKNGMGLLVLSTNKGLMTDKEAREAKLGGEEILRVW